MISNPETLYWTWDHVGSLTDYHALQQQQSVRDILFGGYFEEQYLTTGLYQDLCECGVGPGLAHIQVGSLALT